MVAVDACAAWGMRRGKPYARCARGVQARIGYLPDVMDESIDLCSLLLHCAASDFTWHEGRLIAYWAQVHGLPTAHKPTERVIKWHTDLPSGTMH